MADVQPKSSIPIGAKVEINPKGFTLGVKAELEKVFSICPKLLINAELYGLVLTPRQVPFAPWGAPPKERPFPPLISSFHSPREPLPKSPRQSPFKCISSMLRKTNAFQAYKSLQVETMPTKESNARVLLGVFHISPQYLCFPRLIKGN